MTNPTPTPTFTPIASGLPTQILFALRKAPASIDQFSTTKTNILSTLSYDNISLDISSEAAHPVGLFTTLNGTLMFVLDGKTHGGTKKIYKYKLTSPWDLSTAVYTNDNVSVEKNPDNIHTNYNPSDIGFNADGSKLYVLDKDGEKVFVYDLSTPYILKTAIYNGVYLDLNTSNSRVQKFNGMSFGNLGLKFYVVEGNNKFINQYNLTTPYDVSTATFSKKLLIPSSELTSVEFSADGSKMFVDVGSKFAVYLLSNNWEVDSAVVIKDQYGTISGNKMDIAFYPADIGQVTPTPTVTTTTTPTVTPTNTVTPSVTASVTPTPMVTGSPVVTPTVTISPTQSVTPTATASVTPTNTVTPTLTPTPTPSSMVVGFSLENIVYDSIFLKTGTTESLLQGVHFDPTGTYMYISGGTTYYHQFTLSTPWDVTTATHTNQLSVTESASGVLFFKSDGTKFFVTSSDDIFEYTLSIAWDLSSASKTYTFSTTAEVGVGGTGLFVKPDGTSLWITSLTDNNMYEYSLSSGWDLSTASFASSTYLSSAENSAVRGSWFTTDGLKLFISGSNPDTVHQYTLSVAWDLSTVSYDSVTINLGAEVTDCNGIFFKPDGTVLYVADRATDYVYQYTLSSPFDLTTASAWDKNFWVRIFAPNARDIAFKPDGTKMYVVDVLVDAVMELALSTPWDVSTASLTDQFSTPFSATTQGIDIKPDGTKIFIANSQNDTIYTIDLSVPWDITSASFSSVSFAIGVTTEPSNLRFKPDGTKMYICGRNDDKVYQYTLSVAWDITSASYDSVHYAILNEASPSGLSFNNDGTKMFVSGYGSDNVVQYTLSTPWDVSTAVDDSVSYATGFNNPRCVRFSSNGSKLYIYDQTNYESKIHQYTTVG